MNSFDHDNQLLESLLQEALLKGQQVRCRVYSGSMRPAFEIGDLLVVDGKRPQVGEVAVYLQDKYWITHRVVRIENGLFSLQGDAFKGEFTEKVSERQVIGRVVEHHRDWRAREIKVFRKALTLCPSILRGPLKKLLPDPLKKYLQRKSLNGMITIAE